jgi:hypothetical protein
MGESVKLCWTNSGAVHKMRDMVFISYCREDKKWFDEFREEFRFFELHKDVKVWVDTGIQPGTRWLDEINKGLSQSQVAVILVSDCYLKSNFVTQTELPAIWKRESNGLKIAWVAVDGELFKHTKLPDFQALNNPKRPVAGIENSALRRKEWQRIAEEVYKLLPPVEPLSLKLDTSEETFPSGEVVSKPNKLYSQGWIPYQQNPKGLEAYFVRALIKNQGPHSVTHVRLNIERVESADGSYEVSPGQPLRWRDQWNFKVDQFDKVYADGGCIELQSLPAGTDHHCDLCFYYDLEKGPLELGGLERRALYFAFRNLPSDTYALRNAPRDEKGEFALRDKKGKLALRDGKGEFAVYFKLISDNYPTVEQRFTLHVDLDPAKGMASRVRFQI